MPRHWKPGEHRAASGAPGGGGAGLTPGGAVTGQGRERCQGARKRINPALSGLYERPVERLQRHVEVADCLAVHLDGALRDQAARLARREPIPW